MNFVMSFSIIALFLSLISTSRADYEITAGGGLTLADKYTTGESSPKFNKPLVSSYGGGGIHMEGTTDLFWRFDLLGVVSYFGESAKVQYDYTNPDRPTDSGSMSDLKASLLYIDFRLGLNLTLIQLGPLKVFASGGGVAGAISLSFNEDDYRSRNGFSDNGLKQDGENSSVYGTFADAGLEISGQKHGVRLKVLYTDLKTGVFQTLGGNRFSYNRMQASIVIFSRL